MSNSPAESISAGPGWRSRALRLAPLLVLLCLPMAVLATGPEQAPGADAGVLATLGICGLAWAGRRRR